VRPSIYSLASLQVQQTIQKNVTNANHEYVLLQANEGRCHCFEVPCDEPCDPCCDGCQFPAKHTRQLLDNCKYVTYFSQVRELLWRNRSTLGWRWGADKYHHTGQGKMETLQ